MTKTIRKHIIKSRSIIERCLINKCQEVFEMEKRKKREKESEKMKEMILFAAGDIALREGFEGISIRKIANVIEYTPAIIYHYFKDKEDILEQLLRMEYQKIVDRLMCTNKENAMQDTESVWGAVLDMNEKYFEVILELRDQFVTLQYSKSEQIQSITSFLNRGDAKKKQALTVLYHQIESVLMQKKINKSEEEIELLSQIIAVSSWGLAMKLIQEDIKKEQAEKLIHYQIYQVNVAILNQFLKEEEKIR